MEGCSCGLYWMLNLELEVQVCDSIVEWGWPKIGSKGVNGI